MAKTTFTIPVTGGTITAHNSREAKAVRMFLTDIELAASIFADESDENYSKACEALYRRAKKMEGCADTMYWLGMISDEDYYGDEASNLCKGIACTFQIERICKALAEDMREAQEADNECA